MYWIAGLIRHLVQRAGDPPEPHSGVRQGESPANAARVVGESNGSASGKSSLGGGLGVSLSIAGRSCCKPAPPGGGGRAIRAKPDPKGEERLSPGPKIGEKLGKSESRMVDAGEEAPATASRDEGASVPASPDSSVAGRLTSRGDTCTSVPPGVVAGLAGVPPGLANTVGQSIRTGRESKLE